MAIVALKPTHREVQPVKKCQGGIQISLRRRDGTVAAVALIDPQDRDRVSGHGWHLSGNGYAQTGRGADAVLMHRYVMQAPDELEIDHINRNKLDNRRANLRLADRRYNGQNLPSVKGSSSSYRGVSARGNQWRAQASREENGYKANFWLGDFDDELDAAAAAAQWRFEHMPGSIEDPVLLARPVPRRKPAKRLSHYEMFSLAMIQASTTISRRQMTDMLQIGHHTIKRVLGPGSKRRIECLHHESSVSTVKRSRYVRARFAAAS